MSTVYFGSIQQGRDALFTALAAKVDKIVDLLDFSTIKERDKVAIKMHLGFLDGCQTVPVFFVRRIVKAVRKNGGWPFITDNHVARFTRKTRRTSVYLAVDDNASAYSSAKGNVNKVTRTSGGTQIQLANSSRISIIHKKDLFARLLLDKTGQGDIFQSGDVGGGIEYACLGIGKTGACQAYGTKV